MSKTALTFVTIKWGAKYGADYVNIVHDMVWRNMPPNYPFSFLCFTDNASGLLEGIETRPLPSGLTGWWNKLYLFKAGVFPEGARIFYLDLDTAITGDLSAIASYQGSFAILRDFYKPQGFNSSVMLWRGGFGASIWQSFEEAGRPDISGGDQVWIDRCKPEADILQDLFPGAFLSFKQKAQFELPAGAKIVCFHGDPKPPRIKNGWVEKVWKIGGAPPVAEQSASTAPQEPIENVRHALSLDLPWLDTPHATDYTRQVCIVGGGPSAGDVVEELKKRKQEGQTIWALNGALQKLAAHGIAADAQIMYAANAARSAYVPFETQAALLYASQCHPSVFERAAPMANRVIIWHPLIDGIRNLTGARKAVFVSGGGTTGMRAVNLAQLLGFGQIHLYGFDSSLPGDSNVAPNPAANEDDQPIEVAIDGLTFASTPRLAQQVNEYRLLRQSLKPRGIRLAVHGEGLLPYVAQKLAKHNAL